MILVLKETAKKPEVENLIGWLHGQGLETHLCEGKYQTILGLVGDTSVVDAEMLSGLAFVETVKRIQEPFKKASRKFHPDDTVIDVSGVKIGGPYFQVIAGPCSVESEEQICEISEAVKCAGAGFLRGGAFKPRTSPYAFQGLREEGLRFLREARQKTRLPVITEIMDISQLPLFDDVDVIQVGARNMQNFELLKELGHLRKPILLKRGLANTLEELLMSAEYIMAGGNEQIILCERGIRTFETYTRNTLDLSAVPALKELTHLPVIVDPSHATGISRMVRPMALAAAAAGADGLLIEVHNDPAHAKCDGPQSITPAEFAELMQALNGILRAVGKKGQNE